MTRVGDGLGACVEPLAATYDAAFLDLDGVVYVGESAVVGAAEALQAAQEGGMRLVYVTNNASRTPETVADQLVRLGLPATADAVATSAQAAARLVAQHVPAGSAVLVVGGVGLRQAVAEQGMALVSRAEESPVAVVQGFGPDVGWADLREAAFAVSGGALWVASNLDRTIPVTGGRAPGNGTLVDAVAAAAGRRPDWVAGKPEAPLLDEAQLRSAARRPLMVGDRLDTDIVGARRYGADSLLVLTGVTTVEELLEAVPHERPTYVGADLSALQRAQAQVQRHDEFVSCGSWSVAPGAAWRVTGDGHPDDLLRCLCDAVWHRAGEGAGQAAEAYGRVRSARGRELSAQ